MDAISRGRPGGRRIPGTATRRCGAGHRPSVPLVALAVGLAVVALGPLRPGADRPGAAPAAVAQAGDLAGHPVVGVWRLVDDVGDPLGDNYGLFHADGTYVNVGVGTTFLGL